MVFWDDLDKPIPEKAIAKNALLSVCERVIVPNVAVVAFAFVVCDSLTFDVLLYLDSFHDDSPIIVD